MAVWGASDVWLTGSVTCSGEADGSCTCSAIVGTVTAAVGERQGGGGARTNSVRAGSRPGEVERNSQTRKADAHSSLGVRRSQMVKNKQPPRSRVVLHSCATLVIVGVHVSERRLVRDPPRAAERDSISAASSRLYERVVGQTDAYGSTAVFIRQAS